MAYLFNLRLMDDLLERNSGVDLLGINPKTDVFQELQNQDVISYVASLKKSSPAFSVPEKNQEEIKPVLADTTNKIADLYKSRTPETNELETVFKIFDELIRLKPSPNKHNIERTVTGGKKIKGESVTLTVLAKNKATYYQFTEMVKAEMVRESQKNNSSLLVINKKPTKTSQLIVFFKSDDKQNDQAELQEKNTQMRKNFWRKALNPISERFTEAKGYTYTFKKPCQKILLIMTEGKAVSEIEMIFELYTP